MFELVKICQEKEFLCIHNDVDDLLESALDSKLLLINSNSQRPDKQEQEVKNVVEQPTEHGNRSIQSLQNFRFQLVYEQEPSYNQNYNDNYYPHDSPSFLCFDNCEGSHETFQCQQMDQDIDSSGLDQIQTPQYPVIHPPSHEMKDSNELFQKLLKDLQIINEELAEYINFSSWNRPIFFNDNEDHYVQYKEYLENSSNEIVASNFNQEKEGPTQDSDIRQLVREKCGIEVCEKQKQNMEDTLLELIEVCRQKEFYCTHNNVDDLIESALNSKLLSINLKSQRLDKKKQEAKNIVEQPTKRGTHNERECDVLVCKDSSTFDDCEDHSEILSDSNNDDISSNDDAFEDIEYVKASPLDSELVSLEEENDDYQEDEEFNLEDILQIQDVILREKLLSINRLIVDIESLNDNPTPDHVLNSSTSIPIFEESDNSLSNNSSLEFETFSDHTEETRSGSTTNHANNSFPEYDSFCFEIEPDQERLTSVVMKDIFDDSSNDPLLEEVDLFLALDNSIPPSIENFGYDSEGDIHFLEELLVDDSIPFPENESSDFDHQDDPSFPRPPPEPSDVEFFFDLEPNSGEVISVVMNNIDELNEDECFNPGGEINVFVNIEDDDYFLFMFIIRIFLPYLIYPEVSPLLLSAGSEDTIFDPGISV
nr:hypothetical protein [Tanacetum cinerariifolium]